MNKVHKLNGFVYVTSEEKLPYDNAIFDNGAFYHKDVVGDCYIITKNTFKPNPNFCKRIILTNDLNLKEVQQLTKEEEDYCNSVDKVEVGDDGVTTFIKLPTQEDENCLDSFGVTKSELETFRDFNKKQTQEEVIKESLEEVELIKEAKILWEQSHPNPIEMALFGAKWQAKQMYTEDDLKSAFFNGRLHGIGEVRSELKYNKFTGKQPKNEALDFSEWFKRFKKQKQ